MEPKLPTLRRPALSERPIQDFEGEKILQAMVQLEGKLLSLHSETRDDVAGAKTELSELAKRVASVESATMAANTMTQAVSALSNQVGELGGEVRQVLNRDINQEQRIGALEKQAIAEGKQAGTRAGWSSGAIASAVAAVIVYVIQQLSAGAPPVIPPKSHDAAPIATTALPSGP